MVKCGSGCDSQSGLIANNKLTPEEENIILNEGTDHLFTGALLNIKAEGGYFGRDFFFFHMLLC